MLDFIENENRVCWRHRILYRLLGLKYFEYLFLREVMKEFNEQKTLNFAKLCDEHVTISGSEEDINDGFKTAPCKYISVIDIDTYKQYNNCSESKEGNNECDYTISGGIVRWKKDKPVVTPINKCNREIRCYEALRKWFKEKTGIEIKQVMFIWFLSNMCNKDYISGKLVSSEKYSPHYMPACNKNPVDNKIIMAIILRPKGIEMAYTNKFAFIYQSKLVSTVISFILFVIALKAII